MENDHRLNQKVRTISTETELRSIAKDLVRVLSITTPIFFTVIMGNFIILGGPLILLGATYAIMTAANLTLNKIINRLPEKTADPIRYVRGYANLGIFIWLDYHIPIGLNGWLIYIPFLMISAAFPKKVIHAILLLVFHWSSAVTVAFLKGESGIEIYKIGLVSAIVAVFSLLFVFIFRKYIHALEKEVLLRRKAEDEITKLAFQDSLTGLPNRAAFEEFLITHLSKAEESKEIFAILFLDLEEFKKANDLFGHRFGDHLLAFVGKRLLQILPSGAMVARFGGDEFVFLLNDIKLEENAVLFAKEINRSFDDPFAIEDRMIHITASIGISIYPNHSRDPHKLIQYADMAMYRAKKESKNHFWLYDSSIAMT